MKNYDPYKKTILFFASLASAPPADLPICSFQSILAVRKFAKSFAASMHSPDAGLRPFGHFVLPSFFYFRFFI